MPVIEMKLDEQSRIVSRFRSCEDLIELESKKLNQLNQQKFGLMQDLLTGKVPVKVDGPMTEAISG